jgi:hypothetical protein
MGCDEHKQKERQRRRNKRSIVYRLRFYCPIINLSKLLIMNAIKREITARLEKEREETPISKGNVTLTANQWTLLVVAIITVATLVLNQFGLII